MREVTKVKRLNGETTVEWSEPNGQHQTESALTKCPDKPHKDFLDQLATVEKCLSDRFGFGKKFEDAFTLTGISMTRNSAGRRQFNPSAKIDFGFGETGISLPLLLAPDSEKPNGADNVLSKFEIEAIDQLFVEGLKYAQGEREQSSLDLKPGGDDDEDEDEDEKKAA